MFVGLAVRTVDEVEEELVWLGGQLESGFARWLGLVAEFDAMGGARLRGFRSTVEWLAWRRDLSLRTARDQVCVARRLEELPQTKLAFLAGELSYAKVRVITRAAARVDEAELLRLARSLGAERLEAHLRALPSSPSADPEVERRVYESRFVDFWWDDEGGLQLRGRLPAEDGAVVADALEKAAEAIHPAPDAEAPGIAGFAPGWRPPLGARRADALSLIAASGDAPKVQIVLHADPEGHCAIEGGPAVSPATALRLACDATLVRADGGSGDLGRRMRLPNAAQRNALERRDQGCRFPGCHRRHGLSPHHAEHWAHGGPTDLGNQAMFCAFHHRLFHHDGFSVRQNGAVVTVHAPDGTVIPEVPSLGAGPCRPG